MTDIAPLLSAFLSTDNDLRNRAEAKYHEEVARNVGGVVTGLAGALRHADEGVRTMGAVLLRQLVSKHWKALPAPVQEGTKAALVDSFKNTPTPQVRRRVIHTIAQVCFCAKEGEASWADEVYRYIISEISTTPHTSDYMLLLAKLTEFSPQVAVEAIAGSLIPATLAGLSHANPTVNVMSSKAIMMLIQRIESKDFRAAIDKEGVIPKIITVFGSLLTKDESAAQDVATDLIDLVRFAPSSFKTHIDGVVDAVAWVVQNAGLEPETRRLSNELLISLPEVAGGMSRKMPKLISTAVMLALKMMQESEEDPKWVTLEYDMMGDADPRDPGDGDECAVAAEAGLHRLSAALQGDAVYPVVCEHFPALAAGNWQAKRACLAALGLMSSGCKKQMKPQLRDMVSMCIAMMDDTDQRVRHAAIGTLLEFAQTYSSKKGKYPTLVGDIVFPKLAAAMLASSGNCPRTRTHAANALVSYVFPYGICPVEVVAPHLPALVQGLVEVLGIPSPASQQVALNAISAVATVTREAFAPFYDGFSKGLHGILAREVTSRDAANVFAGAMRCLAHLGASVGFERFEADGTAAMTKIAEMTTAGRLPPDEPFAVEIQKAATIICKTLGEACAPFLPVIMPRLLEAAMRDVQFTEADVDEDATAVQDGNLSSAIYEIKGYGLKRFTMNTTAMEERSSAARMLYDFSAELGAPFLPYVQAVYETIKPMINDPVMAPCRLSVSETIPELARVLINHSEGDTGFLKAQALIRDALQPVISAAMTEQQEEVAVAQLECVADCLNILVNTPTPLDSSLPHTTPPPPLSLTMEELDQILSALTMICIASAQRRQATVEELLTKEDVDELELEAANEDLQPEADLMTYAINSIGYIIKSLRAAALPLIEKHVAKVFAPFLQERVLATMPTLYFNAMCVFVDIVEWCGPDGARTYLPGFLPQLLGSITNEDEEIRQCAVYGVGQLALHAADHLRPHAREVIAKLRALIADPDSRDEDNANCTENAISALGKIWNAMNTVPEIEPDAVLTAWLNALPLRVDEEEAMYNHKLLCELLRAQSPVVMANVPKVVHVFTEVLVSAGGGGSGDAIDMMDEESMTLMVALLKGLATASHPGLAEAMPKLTEAQRGALKAVLTA